MTPVYFVPQVKVERHTLTATTAVYLVTYPWHVRRLQAIVRWIDRYAAWGPDSGHHRLAGGYLPLTDHNL